MKKVGLLLAVGLVMSSVLCGADLKTESGKVYKNVELRRIAGGCVQIVHDDGATTLGLSELPEQFIAALSIRQRHALQSLVDIQVKDGTVYRKTTLESLGGGFVLLNHLGGSVKVAVGDLPAKYRATFTRRQLSILNKTPEEIKAAAQAAIGTGKPTGEKTADGKDIYVGSRGGRFFVDNDGKKVYLKREKTAAASLPAVSDAQTAAPAARVGK
ncbi:MAG: hypothetical protein E7056_06560 [Lentisphaerae bacterium]|nr:hypothetical protein [Lentisphaerota bacterium]